MPLHLRHISALLSAVLLLIGKWSPVRLGESGSALVGTEVDVRTIITMVLGTLVLIGIVHEGGLRRATSPCFAAILGVLVFTGSTILWTPYPEVALSKLWDVGIIALACVMLYHLAGISGWLRLFVVYVVIICVGLSAIAAVGFIGGNGGTRLVALGGGPNVFSRLLGLSVIWFLYSMYTTRRWSALCGALSAVMFVMVLLSGSRGGTLGVVAGVVVLLLFLGVRRNLVIGVLGGGLASWLVLTATAIGGLVSDIVGSRFIRLTFERRHTSGRDVLYERAIDLWSTRPVIGHGLDAFNAYGHGIYPHNIILEMGVEGGWVLVSLFIVSVVCMAVVLYKNRMAPYVSLLAAWIVLYFVASQFSGELYDARAIFWFASVFLSYARPANGSSFVRRMGFKT